MLPHQFINFIHRVETIYNGLPVICIPFFYDQFAHCLKMANHLGMGKHLTIEDITEETFENAIRTVLENKNYKEAAKRAKEIIRDVPVKPKDLFLYWVNYTIRHKGAKHLVSNAPFELNTFQYLSMDVILFLSSFPIIGVIVLIKVVQMLCRLISYHKEYNKIKKTQQCYYQTYGAFQ